MGGAGSTPTTKAGKKPLDAQLNLVPFIDLLSCCISFLLITAVWTQLARMNVAQKGPSAAGASETPPPATVQLILAIDKDGYSFNTMPANARMLIPKKGDEYDYVKLAETLKDAKTSNPDTNDIQIKSDDSVIYNHIITTMDIVLSNKFPNVTLVDAGAAK